MLAVVKKNKNSILSPSKKSVLKKKKATKLMVTQSITKGKSISATLEHEVPLPIKKILVSQSEPLNSKSPFFDLTKMFNVKVDFQPFINIVSIDYKKIRQQKIKFNDYNIIVFTSKNAVCHFFKAVDELKIKLSKDIRYLCTSESAYHCFKKQPGSKKRKIKYVDVTKKKAFNNFFKKNTHTKFLFIHSVIDQVEVISALKKHNCKHDVIKLYNVESMDIKNLLTSGEYQIICLFTPGGVKSIFDNVPNYKKKETLICAYGNNTLRIAQEYGLKVDLPILKSENVSILDILKDTIKKHNG